MDYVDVSEILSDAPYDFGDGLHDPDAGFDEYYKGSSAKALFNCFNHLKHMMTYEATLWVLLKSGTHLLTCSQYNLFIANIRHLQPYSSPQTFRCARRRLCPALIQNCFLPLTFIQLTGGTKSSD